MSSTSRFPICRETLKQASIIEHSSRLLLSQIPETVYSSFSIHSTSHTKKEFALSPWNVCQEKHDLSFKNSCITNHAYSVLNLAHEAAEEAINSFDDEILETPSETNKKLKGLSNTCGSSSSKSKISNREGKDSPSSPRTSKKSLKAKLQQQAVMPFQKIKTISYQFSPNELNHAGHTALYTKCYTYKVLRQYYELRGSIQGFKTTCFDRDLFFAKYNERKQGSTEREQNKKGAPQVRACQPILLNLEYREPEEEPTNFFCIKPKSTKPEAANNSGGTFIGGKRKKRSGGSNPRIEDEIIPALKPGSVDFMRALGTRICTSTSSSYNEEICSKGSFLGTDSEYSRLQCSDVCDYVLNQNPCKAASKNSFFEAKHISLQNSSLAKSARKSGSHNKKAAASLSTSSIDRKGKNPK